MKKLLSQNKLRIIGGKWRGRKFSFPAIPNLRPTPDRVRETLFNWLAPYIAGAKCLDLFAGSGALGLEALSRGAAEVDFFDASPFVIKHLKQSVQQLPINADGQLVSIQQAVFPFNLDNIPVKTYDIVFLDPPFHQNLIPACYHKLSEQGWITPQTLVYIENEADLMLPIHGETVKTGKAGKVSYKLVKPIAVFEH